jgi:hypothetical protein
VQEAIEAIGFTDPVVHVEGTEVAYSCGRAADRMGSWECEAPAEPFVEDTSHMETQTPAGK